MLDNIELIEADAQSLKHNLKLSLGQNNDQQFIRSVAEYGAKRQSLSHNWRVQLATWTDNRLNQELLKFKVLAFTMKKARQILDQDIMHSTIEDRKILMYKRLVVAGCIVSIIYAALLNYYKGDLYEDLPFFKIFTLIAGLAPILITFVRLYLYNRTVSLEPYLVFRDTIKIIKLHIKMIKTELESRALESASWQ